MSSPWIENPLPSEISNIITPLLGAASGIATLDAGGHLSASQIPANITTAIAQAATAATALQRLPVETTSTADNAPVVGAHNPYDATAGDLTPALPTDQALGSLISIEKMDSTSNTVVISGSIRGSTGTLTLQLLHEQVLFEADANGSWWPIAGHKTLASLDSRYIQISGAGLPATVVTSGTAGPVAWAANQQYAVNQLVSEGNQVYICTVKHTSGSSFDPTKFDAFGNFTPTGDLGGTSADMIVETVKGGKTPLTADQNLEDVANVATARTNLGLGSAATLASTAFDPAGAATTAANAVQAAALQQANNLSDLANPATARINLGLGTAATQASTAFDPAGAATAAESAAISTAEASSLQKLNNLSDVSSVSVVRTNLGLINRAAIPAPTGNASTDVANIEAALAVGGIALAQAGTYQINANITMPSGSGLLGQGCYTSGGAGNTTFKCTTAAAGFTVSGSGPLLGHFFVDGNHIANYPFQIGSSTSGGSDYGAQRQFDNIIVANAAEDNWTILYLQNSLFNACASVTATRDNLVFSGGCGGLQINNFESLGAGRNGVYMNASNLPNSSYGLYTQPSRIMFVAGRSEGAAAAAIQVDNATACTYDNFDCFANGTNAAGAVVVINTVQTSGVQYSTGHVFRDVGFGNSDTSNPSAGAWPLYIGPNSNALLLGDCTDYTGKGANVNSNAGVYLPTLTDHAGPAAVPFAV